ncbi:MAG: bifunctional folylpolyglutamate synthase/dihydrofolate synthase [Gemmatimonadetes bacterium]|nr:bifunctional folylpolyglutamate synthase/dihydrofolate synthase [Gemmatimonadota bacterium]
MNPLDYDTIVRELFPRLTGGIRWGLERTRRLLAAVDDPHLRYHTVHVGGTNGKGSVAALLASALRAAGVRTGLYTSPHLCAFRERIQIDGAAISEAALVESAAPLWPVIVEEDPSFFEATTAIAFHALARASVSVAVVEVGLGGRLDATNVIRPAVAVLTNVALDHVQFLGPTIEHVAREKAGIIKAGVPAVTGETGAAALAVFRERAAAVGTMLREIGDASFTTLATDRTGTEIELRSGEWAGRRLRTPLPGAHQAWNAAVAAAALEALPSSLRPGFEPVRSGFESLSWPGRLQIVTDRDRTWVFDVAHNVAGAEALAAALATLALPRPLVALVGVLGDKDWRGMLGPILGVADTVFFTLPPTAPEDRRWDPRGVLDELQVAHARAVPDFGEAMRRAWESAGSGASQGTILVTGSFHTVGDALIALGLAPCSVDAGLPVPMFAS